MEGLWGLPYDRPALRMREYLAVLVPLLEHQDVRFNGELMSTTYRLDATRSELPRPAVFIAALGPLMLAVGATCSSGVATWMVGPRTLETFTVPTANAAAVAAALPAPRIFASLPFLLTDDHDTARDLANTEFALYAKLPAYRTMFEREQATSPADVAVFGTEGELTAAVARLSAAGITDLQITPFGDADQRLRTVELLATL